jgi:hypothetical protein
MGDLSRTANDLAIFRAFVARIGIGGPELLISMAMGPTTSFIATTRLATHGSKQLERQARDVAARTWQARNQTATKRVARRCKYNRDGRCCALCGEDSWSGIRDDDINLEPDQFGSEFGRALVATVRPAIRDRDRATLDPAKFPQPLQESAGPWTLQRSRARAQQSNALRQMLCARRNRARHRAAEKRDELAAFHLIEPHLQPLTRGAA